MLRRVLEVDVDEVAPVRWRRSPPGCPRLIGEGVVRGGGRRAGSSSELDREVALGAVMKPSRAGSTEVTGVL